MCSFVTWRVSCVRVVISGTQKLAEWETDGEVSSDSVLTECVLHGGLVHLQGVTI